MSYSPESFAMVWLLLTVQGWMLESTNYWIQCLPWPCRLAEAVSCFFVSVLFHYSIYAQILAMYLLRWNPWDIHRYTCRQNTHTHKNKTKATGVSYLRSYSHFENLCGFFRIHFRHSVHYFAINISLQHEYWIFFLWNMRKKKYMCEMETERTKFLSFMAESRKKVWNRVVKNFRVLHLEYELSSSEEKIIIKKPSTIKL